MPYLRQEELVNSLNGKDRAVGTAVAVRAVLRALPVLTEVLDARDESEAHKNFVQYAVGVLRCVSLVWFVVKNLENGSEELRLAAVAAQDFTKPLLYPSVHPANIPRALIYPKMLLRAVRYVVEPVAAGVDVDAVFVDSAASAAQTAIDAAVPYFDGAIEDKSLWREIDADMEFVSRRASLSDFLATPLWHDRIPQHATRDWSRMKAALSVGWDWGVWIDWYEARLAGRATSEDYDRAFVPPEEEWKKGASAANAWIREHLPKAHPELSMAEIVAKFKSDPAGARVQIVNGKAQFDPQSDEGDLAAADQPQTLQLLDRARRRASEARSLVFKLANQAGFERIASDVDEIAALLSGDAQDLAANISVAWELSASIGSFVERDDAVKAGRGGLTPEMDADPRKSLDHLLMVLSVLVRRFPTAREHDEAALQSRQSLESITPAKAIIKSAGQRELLEKQTSIVLHIAINSAERSDGVQANKSRSWVSATTRNVISGLLLYVATQAASVGGKFVEGAATKAGEHFYERSQAGKQIDEFLLEKEKEIAELFKDLPPDIRAAIKEVLRRLNQSKTPPSRSKPTIPI